MPYDLGDYVDVAERISVFAAKFPEGCLQSKLTRMPDGWLCKAYAFRTSDDTRPGVGHAFEPVPGKTPYTKDSEAMNAETSAWGRAIVALGFPTKKIASAEEVQNRQGGQNGQSEAAGAPVTAPAAPGGVQAVPTATEPQRNLVKLLGSKLEDAGTITAEQHASLTELIADPALSRKEVSDTITKLKTLEAQAS